MELRRELDTVHIVFFLVGAIIGSGIFMLPGILANYIGPLSLLLWMFAGLSAIYMALAFAELTSLLPHAGGPYSYVSNAFGRKIGFFVAWMCLVISWITIAMTASALVSYVSYLKPLDNVEKIMIIVSVIVILTAVNRRGIIYAAKLQMLLGIFTILLLWTFISWGIYFIKREHFIVLPELFERKFTCYFPLVLEPFIGWQTATFFAEETIEAERRVAKGIIIATLIVIGFYLTTNIIALGVCPWQKLGKSPFPLATATEVFLGEFGGGFIAIGAVFVMLSCLNCWIASSARLPYYLAKEKLLPGILANVHEKHRTPHNALVLQAIIAIVLASLIDFSEILLLLMPIVLLTYFITFLSIPVLKFKLKVKEKGIKIPLSAIIASIAIFVCVFSFFQIPQLAKITGKGYLLIFDIFILLPGVIYSIGLSKGGKTKTI